MNRNESKDGCIKLVRQSVQEGTIAKCLIVQVFARQMKDSVGVRIYQDLSPTSLDWIYLVYKLEDIWSPEGECCLLSGL